MTTLRKLDDYFIGHDDGTLTDRLWFYGAYVMTGAIFLATIVGL